MSYKVQNISNYLLYDTPIENLFVSEYMTSAPGDYVKVYLLALMCANFKKPMDNASLSKELSLTADSVEDAWDYWEGQGLIKRAYPDPENRNSYEIEFVSLKEEVFGRRAPRTESVPRAVSLGDAQLSQLYRDVEAASGRLLESREPEEIAGWIANYGLDPSVIVFGYKYCKNAGKSTKYRYVGAVLKDWQAKGLRSVADIEEYLGGIDRHYESYRKVFKELGFNRNPSEPEKRIMDSWFDEMNFTMDKVKEAIAKTTGTANPNLNYVNSILVSWYKGEGKPEKNDVYGKIEDLYQKIREENEAKTKEQRRMIYLELPRVREIADEITDANYKLSRAIVSGPNGRPVIEALRAKINTLYKEKKELLAAAGYSEDATDDIYSCKDCRDTGLLDDGTRCHCYAEKLQTLLKQ